MINMYETVPFFNSPYKSNTFNTQAYLGNARRNSFFIIRAELREQQQVSTPHKNMSTTRQQLPTAVRRQTKLKGF